MEDCHEGAGHSSPSSSRSDVLDELSSVRQSCSTQWQGLRGHGQPDDVRSGTEMQVKTDRKDLHQSLREMDQGSRVIFEPELHQGGFRQEGGEPRCPAEGERERSFQGQGSM
jgi:hypothetical protein